ncbi:MAG TPA: TonB-dependent receptor [Gemmatimonadales bacterium]|nr:TonB-dependent receptor [Gemmatimonadales bacterium]
MSLRIVRMFAALLCCSAAPLAAQAVGAIEGRVLDRDGAPVAGATLLVEDAASAATTNPDGYFRLRSLPPGAHRVVARRIGYDEAATWVIVPSGGVALVELRLAAAAVGVRGVTVIGTREELAEVREALRLIPGSVDLVEPAEIRSTRQANLYDVLRFTPGVWVQPRFGAADESQLSIRGSGLRNNFHLRGVNILVNGMAYRNADGFTDFESLELLTTEAVEVHKGSNALRYGGSTLGGAINLQTKTGYTAHPFTAFGEGGGYGFFKGQVSSGLARNGFDYYASYSRTTLDGYREWSDQRRDRVNAHVGHVFSPTVAARAFYFYAQVREHLPGSLTRVELDSAPRMADSINVANRWGRDYDLHHVGVQLRTQLTPSQHLEVAPYFQYRDIDHPIFRVIAQVSRDYGAELRYENTADLAGRSNRLTLGFQPAYGNTDNRHYDNQAGKRDSLRKDQKEQVTGAALYLQDAFVVSDRVSGVVGLRYDVSERQAEDFFLRDGDQSDTRTYRALMPKVGLLYHLPAVTGEIYGNVSRSYEPPLLLELNSLTVPGFVKLDAQDAWQFETGIRGRSRAWSWDVAAYDVELRNEILNVNLRPFPGAQFTVPTYRNSPRTRHYGVEAGLEYAGGRLGGRVAYTFARYRFVRDSTLAGNDIPGAPRHALQAELRYRHPAGASVAPTLEWVPQAYFVNSDNTARNDGWAVLGARAEWTFASNGRGLTLFVAAHNLTDARYSPSVQVDNADGRFYEPGDHRALYAGLRWQP